MNLFFLNPARGAIPAALAAHMGRIARRRPASTDSDAYVYDDDDGYYAMPSGTAPLPYVIHDGIAVMDIAGALASSQIPGWYWYANLTYENITAGIEAAVADSEVRGILLMFNSPGGTVTGCAEAADLIDRYATIKPIWSHCQQADSAAYWLASATNRIITDMTGEVGSIGVICTHMDYSKWLEEIGIKVTMLFSGKHKADANPYEPLEESARVAVLADMDYLRGLFAGKVADYRGIELEAVKATEAKTFIGEIATREGLADATAFSHDLLAEFAEFARNPSPQTEETENMAKTAVKTPAPAKADNKKPAAGKNAESDKKDEGTEDEEAAAETDEEEDTAAAGDEDDGEEEGDDEEASKAARTAERSRISAILSAPEAKTRQQLANHLATKTDMSAKNAIAALKASAEESKSNPLAAGMREVGNPKVNAGGGEATTNSLVENMKKQVAKKK